jgi:hypothetical protein
MLLFLAGLTTALVYTILEYSICPDAFRQIGAGSMNMNLAKPKVAVVLSAEEVVELKMIVQDEDLEAALDYVRRLRRKVIEIEQRHCGDPDRLPGY